MNSVMLLMIASLLGCLVLVGMSWRQHRAWLRVHRAHGLLWSINLLKLIMHLQQHRGMASAMLNGDSSFAVRQQEKCRQVDQLLQQLLTLPGNFQRRSEDFNRHDLEQLLLQWQTLLHVLPGLSAFESMTRHTALIGTLLSWLRALGESCLHAPVPATGMPVETLVATFVERLPVLSETLGQARALGTGLLAAGGSSAVGRVQMGYLRQRIEKLQHDTSAALHAGQVDPELLTAWSRTDIAVQQMLHAIGEGVLARTVYMNPADYFRVASSAIDTVFQLIHVLQKRLEVLP